MRKIKIIGYSLFLMFIAYSLFAIPRFNNDPYSVTHSGDHDFTGQVSMSGDQTLTGDFIVTPSGTQDMTLTTDADSSLVVAGLSDVSGDAMCLSGANVVGTCAAAVFTTSVSSPIILSPVSGGADDILIKPAGTTALTIAEGGNATLVGDLTISGEDISVQNMSSSASGGADDLTFSPAGTLAMTVAEGGNVTVVGDITVSGNDITTANMSSAASGGADDMSLKPAGVAGFNVAEAGEIQIMKVVSSHSACAAAGDRGKMELYSVGDTVSFCGCWQSGVATYAWVSLHAGGAC